MIENKSAVTPADAGPVHCPVGRLPEPVESWRKLALQFDAQRMAALIHLRTLLDFPEAHAKVAREFLAAAPQPAERVPLTVPHPGSPEASAMIDSELAARGWPSNSKNAARAGYEACRKLIGADIKPLNARIPPHLPAQEE